jgi:hypothetical protein
MRLTVKSSNTWPTEIKLHQVSNTLEISFDDGSVYQLPCEYLRVYTPSAAGSRYFCESFYGHPCPTSGKNYATAYAFGGPSRPASLVAYPARGMQHSYAMTRRDFVKPAFSLRSAP